MNYKTLVIGASTNPSRFSYLAIKKLVANKVEVVAIGNREGKVDGVVISKTRFQFDDIHTITMYLNSKNQSDCVDYILSLNPKRIIFNPGSENADLLKPAKKLGIKVIFDCTLVMLNNGSYFSDGAQN